MSAPSEDPSAEPRRVWHALAVGLSPNAQVLPRRFSECYERLATLTPHCGAAWIPPKRANGSRLSLVIDPASMKIDEWADHHRVRPPRFGKRDKPRPEKTRAPRFKIPPADGSRGADIACEHRLTDLKPELQYSFLLSIDESSRKHNLPSLVILGSSFPWSGPLRDGEPCPICRGLPLKDIEYCLACDRAGRDDPNATRPRRPQRAPLRKRRRRAG